LKRSPTPLFVADARLDAISGRLALCAHGAIPVPIMDAPSAILIEPGASVSSRAVEVAAGLDVPLVWVGAGATSYVNHAAPQRLARIQQQIRITSDPVLKRAAARRLFQVRYPHRRLHPRHSLGVIRGSEGAFMRELYRSMARRHGVAWQGRNIHDPWDSLDPINRTLSAAHSCLYGISHAAIIATGFVPSLGILHRDSTARGLVFDIADTVKADTTIPLAFQIVSTGCDAPEWVVRHQCAKLFRSGHLFSRLMQITISAFETTVTT